MLPGPEGPIITEFLLHSAIDPDVQACDQDEIFEPDRVSLSAHYSITDLLFVNAMA